MLSRHDGLDDGLRRWLRRWLRACMAPPRTSCGFSDRATLTWTRARDSTTQLQARATPAGLATVPGCCRQESERCRHGSEWTHALTASRKRTRASSLSRRPAKPRHRQPSNACGLSRRVRQQATASVIAAVSLSRLADVHWRVFAGLQRYSVRGPAGRWRRLSEPCGAAGSAFRRGGHRVAREAATAAACPV